MLSASGRNDDVPIVTSFDDLIQALHAEMDKLSHSHREVARYVLAEPDRCAFMTISELSDATDVNESTISRFVRRIGLPGYPALTDLCRSNLMAQSQFISRLEELEKKEKSGDDLLQLALRHDHDNLTTTFAKIDRERWNDAVRALARGRRIYVIGLRKCYSVAHYLSYALGLVREDVKLLNLDVGTLPEQVRGIGPDDVCVGISIHRYTKEVVHVLRFAEHRGATTIALTDDPGSPLNRHADLTFYADSDGASILRSLTAFMSLVQALVAGTVGQLGTDTRSDLLRQEDLLKEFQTYFSDD